MIHSKNSPPEPITYSITFHFINLLKNSRCLQHLCFYAGRAILSSSLIPLIAHCIELLRGPLRPVQRHPPRAFLPLITIQLSKPHLFGLILWPRVRPAPVNTEASTLLCYAHGEVLSVNRIMYLIFSWRTVYSIFLHPL